MATTTVAAADVAADFADWSTPDLEAFTHQGVCRPPQHWAPADRGEWADWWFPVDEVDDETPDTVREAAESAAATLCETCPLAVQRACLASLLRQTAAGLSYGGGIRGALAPHQVVEFLRGDEVVRADREAVSA